MTLQEKTYDKTTEHNIYLDQYLLGLQQRLSKELKDKLRELVAVLLENPSKEVTLAEIRRMQRQVDSFIKEYNPRGNLNNELDKLLDIELDSQVAMLQGLVDEYKLKYTVRPVSKTTVEKRVKNTSVKGLTIDEWLNLWKIKLAGLIKNQLYMEWADEKNSKYDIIEGIGGEKLFNSPVLAQSVNNFNGLTLALATAVVGEVSKNIVNNNTGLIEGQVWNSCLCATTCNECASLHGKVRTRDNDETGGAEIPLHPYCMCHWTFLYKDESKMSFPIPIIAQGDINNTEEPKKFQVWYNSISREEKEKLFGEEGLDPSKSIRKNLEKITSLRGLKKRLQE